MKFTIWLEGWNWARADAVALGLIACFLAAAFALSFYLGNLLPAGLYLAATLAVALAAIESFGLADEIEEP